MPSLPFVVHGSKAGVKGWSPQRLPSEPKGWMLEYRTALREALRKLDWANRPVLVASFTSAGSRPCDVENLLRYNLGLSAFAHLSSPDDVSFPGALCAVLLPGPLLRCIGVARLGGGSAIAG